MATETKVQELGGITDVHGAANSVEINNLARFAVEEQNKRENSVLEFVRVISAKQQVVAGVNYYITLEAKDGLIKNEYEAKVWVREWLNSKELLEFKPVNVSSTPIGGITDVTANSLEIDILARFAVDQHNKKENANLEFVGVIRAKQQVVEGFIYYITLEAKDGETKNVYETKAGKKEATLIKQEISERLYQHQIILLIKVMSKVQLSLQQSHRHQNMKNRGVNEMTPEKLSSLKEDLTRHIWWDKWLESKSIIDKCPDMVRIPLNDRGDTALHVAVSQWSLETVKELVKRMSPEDMLIPNLDGMLPVHLAALYGRNIMVQILSSQKVLDKMDSKHIELLFLMTIRFNMFDLAMRLFEKHPTTLAIARNEEHLTALHMLARKPPESLVLFDAIKSGNVEAVKMLIDKNRELVTIKDPQNGRNLLHLVVLFRQKRIFISMLWGLEEHIVRAVEVDNEGNNILHLAAHLPVEFEELSSLRASIQMQRELEWFKFVETCVPRELRRMRNNMGKRPIDVFYEEHKKLSEEIKDAARGIAEYGMLVSTLVATVAFAAALTVPGDKTNAWFTVFILTNAVALFTSSASLLSFLSNFTSSRFAQSEFVKSLHPSLTFGRALLFISVFAMVVAFTAASFLMFDHKSKWVAYLVASMAVFPILLFLLFQINFLDDLLWSRYYRLSKLD
ncbi:hypothetical protein JHK84_039146 [Glycine max]|nr:hypothetical protein JHK84_039146 [Glycine max]